MSKDDRKTDGTTTTTYEDGKGQIQTDRRDGSHIDTERDARKDITDAGGKVISVERDR